MKRCQEPHPGGESGCILPDRPHDVHYDGSAWWGEPSRTVRRVPPPSRKGGGATSEARRFMLDARARTQPEGRADGAAPDVVWTESAWLAEAGRRMDDFLATRSEPFTTPEHLWPLLPDPAPDVDRRILVRLVRNALRAGVIREEGAVRLKDTYRTADGTTFEINKLVPTYRVVR